MKRGGVAGVFSDSNFSRYNHEMELKHSETTNNQNYLQLNNGISCDYLMDGELEEGDIQYRVTQNESERRYSSSHSPFHR